MPQPADALAPSDLYPRERDIDLPGFLAFVWQLRLPLAAVGFLVAVAYWGNWYSATGQGNWTPAYTQTLRFVFDGAEQGRYPNGTPFDLNDVIAPNVIGELYEAYGFAERGIDAHAFRQSFGIAPHVPYENELVARYMSHMAQTLRTGDHHDSPMLSVALRNLRAELEDELARAGRRAAQITFRPPAPPPGHPPGAMQSDEAYKLLLDLPRAWARSRVQRHAVLPSAPPAYAADFFAAAEFSELDYLPALDKLRGRVEQLADAIAELRLVPRAAALRDPATGAGLADAEAAVARIADYTLRPLAADVAARGIARRPEQLARQYEYRMQQYERLAQQAAAEADALRPAAVFAEQILALRRAARRHAEQAGALRQAIAGIGAAAEGAQEAQEVEQRLAAALAALRAQASTVLHIRNQLGPDSFGADQALYRYDHAAATAPAPLGRRDIFVFALLLAASLVAVLIAGGTLHSLRARIRPA